MFVADADVLRLLLMMTKHLSEDAHRLPMFGKLLSFSGKSSL